MNQNLAFGTYDQIKRRLLKVANEYDQNAADARTLNRISKQFDHGTNQFTIHQLVNQDEFHERYEEMIENLAEEPNDIRFIGGQNAHDDYKDRLQEEYKEVPNNWIDFLAEVRKNPEEYGVDRNKNIMKQASKIYRELKGMQPKVSVSAGKRKNMMKYKDFVKHVSNNKKAYNIDKDKNFIKQVSKLWKDYKLDINAGGNGKLASNTAEEYSEPRSDELFSGVSEDDLIEEQIKEMEKVEKKQKSMKKAKKLEKQKDKFIRQKLTTAKEDRQKLKKEAEKKLKQKKQNKINRLKTKRANRRKLLNDLTKEDKKVIENFDNMNLNNIEHDEKVALKEYKEIVEDIAKEESIPASKIADSHRKLSKKKSKPKQNLRKELRVMTKLL